MKQPLTPAQWFCAPHPNDVPVVWQEEHIWTLGHLRHDVAQLLTYLRQQEGERRASCFENSYLSVVALLTTLYVGEIPVIPGHYRISLPNEQHLLFGGVLSDRAMDWQGTLWVVSSVMTSVAYDIMFPAICSGAFVELSTFGLTGQPKRAIRPITRLDSKAALLATRFVDHLAGCRMIAPVVP